MKSFIIEDLLQGIKFLLGLQLILVAVAHFIFKPDTTRIILAFLCLLLGLWFFKKVFYGYWQGDLFLFILIGPGKPIFVGALLLFYYRSYRKKLTGKYILKYTLAPALYYATLVIFRFFLIDKFSGANTTITYLFSAGIFTIFLWYFFLTRKELKNETQKILIPKAYKKVMVLFYSLYFFLLQIPVWDAVRNILKGLYFSEDSLAFIFITKISLGIYIYLYFLAYFLFIYALSEFSFFKKLFLPNDVALNKNSIVNSDRINHLLETHLNGNKLYKNPDLTIASCAKTLGVSKKELIDHFKIMKKGSFKEYINTLRIGEFKTLLQDEKFKLYDLVGLAKECGFKSKTTFFRVFKEAEGVTPNEFRKKSY